LEVVKKIREVEPEVQVIVITGHGDSDLAVQASHLQVAAFLNKPISRAALESALRQAEENLRRTTPNQEKPPSPP
jgi:DNA-binding NtrC family response regulator